MQVKKALKFFKADLQGWLCFNAVNEQVPTFVPLE
ncbi:hypothetical protein SLEP1_g7652 [Rubroshorea leprosula]|uniref:Uncharacterized protein n=1 Tax=Rubroshorea leprosula TaxID=152421 RepID=A0AAV5I8Z7_9ROSI|nr:hypothetical protein SLEP1_g7652 [Rubroshorea leprosula]